MNDPVLAPLLERVSTIDHAEALRVLRDQIHERLVAVLPSSSVEQFNDVLNEAHDALIGRAIALAEREAARSGMGSPPVPYAYLLFGSGGRKEQTLSSDQDSGLIYDDPPNSMDGGEVRRYFHRLGELVVKTLERVGYPPCEGNVLSSNPLWCDSLAGWKGKLDEWFAEAHWEVVRYLLIVADGRTVYGEQSLLRQVKEHYFRDTLEKPVIVRRMLDNTMRHKVLIGVFGQLLRERYGEEAGSLDVKYGAYIPMVNAIRLLAIGEGIRETSTLGRIGELAAAGVLTGEDARAYAEAFRFFVKLRLLTISEPANGLYDSSGKLAGSRLTKELAQQLKQGLRTGKRLQRSVYKRTMGKLR